MIVTIYVEVYEKGQNGYYIAVKVEIRPTMHVDLK